MIYSLSGILEIVDDGFIVIECSGVGYKCSTTTRVCWELSKKIGENVKVLTCLNVREGAIELFGFLRSEELSCFRMLTSVSGVGARAGLSILSEFSPERVASFVSTGDAKSMTKASGVGEKTARRIVLELRDKLKLSEFPPGFADGGSGTAFSDSSGASNVSEALNALSVLGYSRAEVVPIIAKLDSSLPVEELIRLTLKSVR